MKKKFISMVLIFVAALGLAGCNNDVSIQQAADQARQAAAAAKALEAAKAEARWIAARDTLRNIGKTSAKEGDYTSAKNCEVLPAALVSSSAYQEFKVLGLETYKGACSREVGIIAAERKAERNRAVARAKEAERKAAIAKAKHDQKVAAAKKAKHGGKVAVSR